MYEKTEEESFSKYPPGTAWWEKDSIEYYTCTKHGKKTQFHRNIDIVVHTDETECW